MTVERLGTPGGSGSDEVLQSVRAFSRAAMAAGRRWTPPRSPR